MLDLIGAGKLPAKAQRLRCVGLFGTRFTMQAPFYPEVFARAGITVVTPEPAEQVYIREKYMNELVNGMILSETRAGLMAIAARLQTERGIEG